MEQTQKLTDTHTHTHTQRKDENYIPHCIAYELHTSYARSITRVSVHVHACRLMV